MKHTISVTVENKFGVLARVSGLFSSRGYNIDSLAVGETENHAVSRMTIVVEGDDRILEQVMKQLNKLIDVIDVTDLKTGSYVSRELMLMKVRCSGRKRTEVLEIANVFRAKTIDISHESVILLVTGTEEKVLAIKQLMEPFGILELTRTGKVAMLRETNSCGDNGAENK
ncbi:acetolactate synthase small subunit [Candidatus Latescibacterota bacterium]